MAVTVTQQMYDFIANTRTGFAAAAQQSGNERDQAEQRRVEQQRLVDDLGEILANLEVEQ